MRSFQSTMANHYTVKADVVLDAAATAYVAKVASAFYQATGKNIVVTSAYRGPAEQAAAMYGKFTGPEWNIYKDKSALSEIHSVFLRDRSARKTREQTIGDMAEVIRRQVGQHRYISSHLIATAVDFRKVGLTAVEKTALIKAARDAGGRVVIDEGSPPHLHVQF